MSEILKEVVAIPTPTGGRPRKYPWDQLEVNGPPMFEKEAKIAALSSSAWRWSKNHCGGAAKFAMRKMERNGAPGVMVWRIQ